MNVECRVYGRPVSKGSWKNVGQGRAIASNRDNLRIWEYEVTQAVRRAIGDRQIGDDPVSVTLRFHFARPKGHFRRDGTFKPSAPAYFTRTPDLDKVVRAVLDAITNAGLWDDDAQVIHLEATKVYTSNMRNQGVEIAIRTLGEG